MSRGAKPAKTRSQGTSHVARTSRKTPTTTGRRLEQRLADALEQQAATSEVLRVISHGAFDLQSLFEKVAEHAVRLCGADRAFIYRWDGTVLRVAVAHGASPELEEFVAGHPIAPGRHSGAARAALERRTVHIPDVHADPDYTWGAARVNPVRTVLAVPMLKGDALVGIIVIYTLEVKPFTGEQIALMQTFADQAVIAIENVRQFNELESRNRDLAEALDQQMATSEILRVISQSQRDLQPVFETIAAAALRLCGANSALVTTFDGKLIHLAAVANVNPEAAAAIHLNFPIPPGRSNANARAVMTCSVVAIPDVLDDAEYAVRATALAGGFRSVLAVPLVREGNAIGAISVGRPEPGSFPDKQIELLHTFANQAVIAIANVRLFNELGARNHDLAVALEQQAATSEILRVISASPTDVQPALDTVARLSARLCKSPFARVLLVDGDVLISRAHFAVDGGESGPVVPVLIKRTSITGRAVVDRATVHHADVVPLLDTEFPDARENARLTGFRAVLAVPLLREGAAYGGIFLWRREPGLFSADQVALVETFARQVAISIENVRLFKETKEALEQQTATSNILSVISQSQMDVQPVFDTIVAAAMKLCAASSANVFTFDGELVHLASHVNVNPTYVEVLRQFFPRPPGRDTAVLRAILTRSVVAIPDVLDDKSYADRFKAHATAGGFRSVLAVPLIREGNAIGGIAVGRAEPGPFPHTQVALLQTFADQAIIAIENVRLFTELEARTAELTRSVGELRALGDVGQAVSSTLDLETVLATIVSRAAQLAGMDGGSIWEYDEAREEFYLHATDRLPDELIEVLRATPIRKGEGALGRLALTGEPVEIRNIADEHNYPSRLRKILLRSGYRAVLAVPLLREDHLLGALAVNRTSAGEFAPEVIELLKTFATQSALAIQNARLFREIEEKSRQLEIASQHKSEFLANMSHELRTPLNAIIGFSEVLAEQMFGEINDKQAEYLSDILESGRHLLSLINDILDLSKIEAGRMELEAADFSLPGAIDNTLTLIRERAHRRGITLVRDVGERVGMIRGDERKVKQVLLNLLSNALKFTPEGGQVDVRAITHDGVAEISVTDTGVGIAPEDQATVFEEFRQVGTAAKKVEGTGLGLAISRKFIELHGGTIWVRSNVGSGSTFAFTLPLTAEAQPPLAS